MNGVGSGVSSGFFVSSGACVASGVLVASGVGVALLQPANKHTAIANMHNKVINFLFFIKNILSF